METLDHRTYVSKLVRTIKEIDGKSPPKAENEAITFDDSRVSCCLDMWFLLWCVGFASLDGVCDELNDCAWNVCR